MSLLNAAKNMSLVGCKVTYKDSMADNEPLSFYIMDFSVVQGENLVIGLDGPPFFFDTAKSTKSSLAMSFATFCFYLNSSFEFEIWVGMGSERGGFLVVAHLIFNFYT